MNKAPDKGKEILLDIRDSARRRVICGLRWDPLSGPSENLSRTAIASGANTSVFDLDLLCLMYDRNGKLIEAVTGQQDERTGDNGNVYHTGDVIDGADLMDDEQISIELFNLSRKIHQIVFIAEVQSAHVFGDVANPQIRVASAIDDRNFAHIALGKNAGADKNAYIFGSLIRRAQGWAFRHAGEYLDGSGITDWAQTLLPYLDINSGPAAGTGASPVIPASGQTVPLFYSKEKRQRVYCSLSWDPADAKSGIGRKLANLGRNVETCDLDLACVMFGSDRNALDGVSAKAEETIDSSGKVYHTGDDTTGDGDLDDETISVELRNLPAHIHHIVFLAEIQSVHTFDTVPNPRMRLVDSGTELEQVAIALDPEAGFNLNAYVFARISRKGEGWTLTWIDKYLDGREVDDWLGYLQRYLG